MVQSIETGPFTDADLRGHGPRGIPWPNGVLIAPIFVGAILGNLDDDIRTFFQVTGKSSFRSWLSSGTDDQPEVGVDGSVPGIVLGVTVLIVTGAVHRCRPAIRRNGNRQAAASAPPAIPLRFPSGCPGRPVVAAVAGAATVQVPPR
jgi:2-keto-3-deoxygluconate permease